MEPPELADGADHTSRQNGQNQSPNQQGNRNRQNQNSQNRSQADGDVGNRRSRRRRGRERGQGGELQGGGQEQPYSGELVEVKGMLDLRDEGYGFLRCEGYLPSPKDVYVSISQARRFALRRGDYVEGACRPASNNEKYPALLRIDSVSGLDPEAARNRPRFEDLTPLFPDSRLNLEMPGDKDNLTARIVDLLSPIGKGQRGMIVSPPKAGKTTVMKQIAHSIEANNPEVHLMVLLVDERPEEVTDMRRSVKGEVIASTFDRPADEHTQVAELAIERAKRLVEMGRDVVIVLDGITRLARAYNLAAPATGRIMSGGVDSGALYPPKKFFGAAAQRGGGRLAHDPGLGAGGDRLEDGRGHLRGVQGHRQHGAPPRPPAVGASPVPGHRRQRQLDPPRGAALRARPAPAGLEAAPGAQRTGQRRQGRPPAWSCSWTRSAPRRATTSSWRRSPRAPAPDRHGVVAERALPPAPPYTGSTDRHWRNTMKPDIHPDYVEATVKCSCGNTFTTHSTKADLHVELCNECHPFFTGKQKLVDSGGRVERFQRRYGERKGKAKAKAAPAAQD